MMFLDSHMWQLFTAMFAANFLASRGFQFQALYYMIVVTFGGLDANQWVGATSIFVLTCVFSAFIRTANTRSN